MDGTVEIRVRDTGIGIPPMLLPMIFDMFTQLNHQTGRAQSGLGIGLALVRKLLEMHGGTVTAYSEGNGRGSEFLITSACNSRTTDEPQRDMRRCRRGMPDRRREARSRHRSGAGSWWPTTTPMRWRAWRRCWSSAGMRCSAPRMGRLRWNPPSGICPEVALLDIGMPKLDGYEVARRIRAQPWGHRITLVALTGWGQDSDRRRSGEAGFDSHLVKPLDLDKLTELLGRLPRRTAEAARESVSSKVGTTAA